MNALHLLRMRMGFSALKSQRADYSLIPVNSCDACSVTSESPQHLFSIVPATCCRQNLRGLGGILRSLGTTVDADKQQTTSLLLNGSKDLNHENNNKIFELAHKFINQSFIYYFFKTWAILSKHIVNK